VTPLARGALYGLGPVVIALFAVALYRLGTTAARSVPEAIIGVAAAAAAATSRAGVVAGLVVPGWAGRPPVFRGSLRGRGRTPAAVIAVGVVALVWWMSASVSGSVGGWVPDRTSLADIGLYFLEVGAFTIGGGLTMIAFIQQQVVGQFGWLTPREFVDGLALGQLTVRCR